MTDEMKTAATQRALSAIEHGAEFPYDASDAWSEAYPNEPAPPAIDAAHACARGILVDLKDRRDIGSVLESLDEEVRTDLVGAIAEIVRVAMARPPGEPDIWQYRWKQGPGRWQDVSDPELLERMRSMPDLVELRALVVVDPSPESTS